MKSKYGIFLNILLTILLILAIGIIGYIAYEHISHYILTKEAEEAAASADPEIDAMVAARTEAKKAKNYAEADRIRDELKAQGIEIIDAKDGASWKRV